MEAELRVEIEGHVGTVFLRRPPNNFIDTRLVGQIASALEDIDRTPRCRAVVLASEGKHFCAGADLTHSPGGVVRPSGAPSMYEECVRLLQTRKPIVAAVQGAAIGAGLGLALIADFRVTCPEARFSANFTRLGYHPGFGLTATLPRLVGAQKACLLFYSARRIPGDEAFAMGLADALVPRDEVLGRARALASEIGSNGPQAIAATRATMRRGLSEAFVAATRHEQQEQDRLERTSDFREGVRAMAERRVPDFSGR